MAQFSRDIELMSVGYFCLFFLGNSLFFSSQGEKLIFSRSCLIISLNFLCHPLFYSTFLPSLVTPMITPTGFQFCCACGSNVRPRNSFIGTLETWVLLIFGWTEYIKYMKTALKLQQHTCKVKVLSLANAEQLSINDTFNKSIHVSTWSVSLVDFFST